VLSVIIPVFNERATLPRVILAVTQALPRVDKEVVLVDDGSTDGTREWIAGNVPGGTRRGAVCIDHDGQLSPADGATEAEITIRAIFHDGNQGKGAALRTGFAAARGSVLVIQDADLEYDPADWGALHALIATGGADVVYGSRFLDPKTRFPFALQVFANSFISRLFGRLYGGRLTDVMTCTKMFTRAAEDGLRLVRNDFGCEIDMAMWFAGKPGLRIAEIAISYRGRTYAEGKKIRWHDGYRSVWYMLALRVRPRAALTLGPKPPHS
jgi:glycosyltransferase involved in cell wall biosynthesis